MSDLERGMLVQHASMGLGKVVALEEKAVHVYFATSQARFATKLRLPMARPLLVPSQRTDAWLSGLSGFALDARSGRWGLADAWLSHQDAVARFLDVHPAGFAGSGRVGDAEDKRERVARWRKAHQAYEETLGGGEAERLLAAGEIGTLTERALLVERHVRPLHRDAEKASFEEALANTEAAPGYFAALLELLAAPSPERPRFEALAAAVARLAPQAPPEARWPLVTLLPFVAQPERHLLLRPRFAREVAQRLGLELAFDAEPNWTTYAALLRSAEVLLERLRPLGAVDHVDVEWFMHAVTAKQARPKAGLRLPSPGEQGLPGEGGTP